MKKKIIGIVFAAALVLSIGAVAYAATGGFTMTYLPGTTDTVTDIPPADSGTGGQVYTVSSKVPQREGYEFIDWTLDYEQKPEEKLFSYTVRYADYDAHGCQIAPDKVEKDIPEGELIREDACWFDNYIFMGYVTLDDGTEFYDDSVSLNIDRDNIVITFYYYMEELEPIDA